jgi:RsiW-degrading membrane proteinase PrsW (M82 family)
MAIALGLSASVAVVLALLAALRGLDGARPTPRRVTWTTFGLGALACVPAIALELLARSLLGDAILAGGRFLDAFVVAALVEESIKLAVVLLYARRVAGVLDVMDGVVYSAAASLGFGLIENAVFAWSDPRTALLRSVTAVPIHAAASGIMGYLVGRASFVRPESRASMFAAGLGGAVLLHGLYDWAIFYRGPRWELQALTVLAVGVLAVIALVRDALKLDRAMYGPAALASLEQPWPANVTQTLVPGTPRAPAPPRDATASGSRTE